MRGRSSLLILAAAVCFAAGPLDHASAAIMALTDSGSAGAARLTNLDGSNFRLDFIQPKAQWLNTINGSIVDLPVPALFNDSITFQLVSGAGTHDYVLQQTQPGDKWFVPQGSNTHLTYALTMGESGHLTGSLTLDGRITSVPEPILTLPSGTYDFSPMLNGGIQFVMTSPTFTGTSSFFGLFQTVGATATGSVAFSQTAIPEPGSWALLGIGLSGLLAFRRRLARRFQTV